MYRDRIMKVIEKRRKIIQLMSALIYNLNLNGFMTGAIYKGNVKSFCVPGLNCYSCPGAIASCPLGSIQTALITLDYRFPFYVIGTLLLFGVLLGRSICGFLCPFGLIQELMYKIPTKKIKKNNISRKLSMIKYIILILFVLIIPLIFLEPGFCKYICPAGTLEAGIIITSFNSSIRELTGILFSWKILILLIVLIISVFVYRGFCRFICPLGAFYAMFNKISLFNIEIDKNRCNGCRECINVCKMDVLKIGDGECIRCGECINACKSKAIVYKIMK